MAAPEPDPLVERVPARRAPGLLILAGVVLLGLVPTSLYFHWKVPGVIEEFRELVRNAPKTPEGRLELWFEMNRPQVHNRLGQFRLSGAQPWMVVYARPAAPGAPAELREPLEVFGIDLADLPVEAVRRDGLDVSVELPAPRSLGVHRLRGDNASRVLRVADGAAAPDPTERAMDMIEYALRHPEDHDFLAAFSEDNPEARFLLRVGERERVVAPVPAPAEAPGG